MEISEIDARIAEIEAELASRDSSDLQEKKYRAAAEVAAKYDPQQAMAWTTAADNLASNRSKFQYQKEQDSLEMEYKRAKDLLNMENPSKTEIKRFEQLWKDLERSKREALSKYGASSVYYTKPEELQQRVEAKLQQLAPELWGAQETAQETAPVTPVTPDAQTEEVSDKKRSEVYKEFKKSLLDKAVDKNKDGFLDVPEAELKASINEFARKKGWGADGSEVKTLTNLVEGLAKDAAEKEAKRYKRSLESRNQALKERQAGQSAASINAERAKGDVGKIREAPGDIALRTGALNTLLRSESGAAIGKGEVLERIMNLVPSDVAKKIMEEQSGFERIILDKAVSDDHFTAMIVNKYVRQIDPQRLIEQLRIRAGEKAEDIFGTAPKPKQESEAPSIPPGKTRMVGGFTVRGR